MHRHVFHNFYYCKNFKVKLIEFLCSKGSLVRFLDCWIYLLEREKKSMRKREVVRDEIDKEGREVEPKI